MEYSHWSRLRGSKGKLAESQRNFDCEYKDSLSNDNSTTTTTSLDLEPESQYTDPQFEWNTIEEDEEEHLFLSDILLLVSRSQNPAQNPALGLSSSHKHFPEGLECK